MKPLFSVVAALLLLAAAGCSEDGDKVRVYKISHPNDHGSPANTESTDAGPAPAATPPASGNPPRISVNPSSSMTALPGMESTAAAIDTPDWTVPAGWEVLAPTTIRKGNFQITEGSGKVEVTVTAFPGDVGGLAANVNRWRRQIGLPPLDDQALMQSIELIDVDGREAYYVNLLNMDAPDSPGILGAVIPRDSRTWFVKMVGSQPILAQQPTALKEFLSSIDF